jgi:glyoxylase-like metal-dependent hydrolase (beta-lactamase superfamily II)
MTIKIFVFNPFQLNTYLVYDETKQAIIIDAGNSNMDEDKELFDFIEENGLNIQGLYYTHSHVDHILGNNSIINKFKLKASAHKDSVLFFETANSYAPNLGLEIKDPIFPSDFIFEEDIIEFGNSKLKVLHTPGHADGSLCFYSEEEQFIIVGDVLFKDSIGRTDLPTGDYDLLMKTIKEKIFTLPNSVKVFPGHGPSTSIGYEKMNNPFINFNL